MKTFNEFLTESAGPLSLSDFPLYAKAPNVTSKELGWLQGALDNMNAAYRNGAIPNPVYMVVKDTVNRAIERMLEKPEHVLANAVRKREEFTLNDFYYNQPYAHTIPGTLKKALAAKPTSYADKYYMQWYMPALQEAAKLAEYFLPMKAMAVKRVPKAPEDMHAKYVAPMSSMESGKLVIDALTKMTEAIYADFAAAVTKWMVREVESLAAMTRKEQNDSRNEFMGNYKLWQKSDWSAAKEPKKPVKNYKAILKQEGIDAADQMQKTFVFKNAKKLASIIEGKKIGLKGEPEILSARAGTQGHFEGDMRISFVDGSKFSVRNQVVFKHSIYGTFFMQYPTTFHDVTLPNGSAMKQPSEERMNEVFVTA